ncbi:uncharacterized protein [Battus philenor]|uniref:uncharacterized protein n=1 Tax=Battus philenor TaxID=42288 RepID=UPI0035D01486
MQTRLPDVAIMLRPYRYLWEKPMPCRTIYVTHDDGKLHHEHHHHHPTAHQIQEQATPKHKEPDNIVFSDDNYTFVALIDEMKTLRSVQPELTGSFVIIGTKQMFDSGYEQYLPIERVLLHPDYKQWSADLAMVYTFSGMMSDKPGNIIPLADGNSFTSVHSNVTVINWNQMTKNNAITTTTTMKPYHSDSCSDSSEEAGHYHNKVTHSQMTQRIFISSEEDISGLTTKAINQLSTLYTEEYSIFEPHVCRQMVLKLKLQIVDETKIVCYTIMKPNKIQGNYGALTIHRNHLVAVAAGDISNDIEHIIVGTKISCFCSWIAENLPGRGTELNCCTNCCEGSLADINTEKYF